jgi:hypothetical protein
MKKLTFIIIALLSFHYHYGNNSTNNCYNTENHNSQFILSIKDIISIKNLSFEKIHDYLILKDWVYVSSKNTREGGSFSPMNLKTVTYENRYYDINIHLLEKTWFTNSKRNYVDRITKEIHIETESSEVYKNILQDLYNNRFFSKGEGSTSGNIELLGLSGYEILEKKKKNFVRVEYSVKDYSDGRNNVSVSIEVLEKYDYYNNKIKKQIYTLKILI